MPHRVGAGRRTRGEPRRRRAPSASAPYAKLDMALSLGSPCSRSIGCYLDLPALAEIAENLHRRDIGEIERAELVARWIDVTKRRSEEAQSRQPAAIEASKREDGRGHRRKGGGKQAARDLGVEETSIRRAMKIAALSPEAKAAARAKGVSPLSARSPKTGGGPFSVRSGALRR